MARPLFSSIEPLESRIAPAAVIAHPLPDIVAGIGKTGATIDLGNMFDASNGSYDTIVNFTTNFDTDTSTPGLQAGHIVFELFDSKAPLTVQNFLSYINNPATKENFLGTFFHRLASGFVLQGGGYDAVNPGAHIPTGVAVHNEFDPNDPSRSNTAGTLAMAETGSDQNSATSEFFVNLADNSANLDHQNGGFTVFGKVLSGMDVVNQIASLPTTSSLQNVNGALDSVPYQGTLGASGMPTKDQLITITDVNVTPPDAGHSPGYTFKVLSVSDSTTHKPTKLLTATVAGEALGLKYKHGASGSADVTVQADDGQGNVVTDTFTVKVEPNLVVQSAGDTLNGLVVHGDTGQVSLHLTNNGGGSANGKVEVKVYLAPIDPSATGPVTLDPAHDILVGDFFKTLDITSGGSGVISGNIKVPAVAAQLVNGAAFQLIEQVTSPTGSTVHELFSDDNVTTNGSVVDSLELFGNFSHGTTSSGHAINPRINVPLTYTDAANNLVTLTYSGDEAGLLIHNTDGTVSLETGPLGLKGNASLSTLKVKVTPGPGSTSPHTSFEDFTALDSIGNIGLGSADFTGNINLVSGAGTVLLGNLLGDDGLHSFTFNLGDSGLLPAVQVGNVTDYSLTAASGLKSLTAASWNSNNPAQETISAPSLASLHVTGDLAANVVVNAALTTPPGLPTGTHKVNSFVVGGTLTNASVQIAGNVGNVSLGATDSSTFTVGIAGSVFPTVQSFKVTNTLKDSTVQVAGNVGSVVLGAMDTSNFLVGVTGTDVPDARTDFSGVHGISTFTITGIAGSADPAMIASHVAAASFGTISVTNVDTSTANEPNPYGFIAEFITKYQRDKAHTLTHPPSGQYDTAGSYLVNVLPLA